MTEFTPITTTGGVVVGVNIRGIPELDAALKRLDQPAADKLLQQAADAGAKALVPPIRAAAPQGPSGNRYTKPGALKRSIRAYKAKRDKPGAYVRAASKVAFYRHMVVKGTKAHDIKVNARTPTGGEYQRVVHHPGVKRVTPYIDIGTAQGEAAAQAAIDAVISAALGTGG